MEPTAFSPQGFPAPVKERLFLKSVFIFITALALWIPTYFIRGLVKERQGRQQEAIDDISSKWAGKQVVTGPVLMFSPKKYNGKTQFIKPVRFKLFKIKGDGLHILEGLF